MTPATLIDKRITWENINGNSVKVTFTDNRLKVCGILTFNIDGELEAFSTCDILYQEKDKSYCTVEWVVLLKDYKIINGINISTYSEVTWHFKDREFCCVKLNLIERKINCIK